MIAEPKSADHRATELADVRRYVRGLLEDASAFNALPAEERKKLARDLVTVLSYLTDERGGLSAKPAIALESGNLVGKDFKAGAAREGVRAFKQLVSAVDFPKFVAGLIDGVYKSIVSSSIQQMEAYGKLLAAVVKSVQQFAQENISLEEARAFVEATHKGVVLRDGSGEGKLRLADDAETAPDFKSSLDMTENVSLEDEESELKIVLAAQLKLARQRQQQLATMMMLGINRIIVTDGEIKASVLFDVKTRDTAARSSEDRTSEVQTHRETDGSWWSNDSTVDTKVSTAYSEDKEKSSADMDMRAKLSGSVTVRFKSETFPLERLASPDDIGKVQERGKK